MGSLYNTQKEEEYHIRTNRATGFLSLQYLLVLSTIALLIIVGFVSAQFLTSEQSSHSYVINIAGRQRMFGQQITKDVLIILNEDNIKHRNEHFTELSDSLSIWSTVHQKLSMGGKELGLTHMSAEALSLMRTLDPDYRAIAEAAECILNIYNSSNSELICDTELTDYISIILAHEHQYLLGMDAVVSQLEAEATGHIQSISRIELIIMVLTLFALVLQAIFIFRPAIERMQYSFAKLLSTQADLSKTNEILQKQVAERKQIEQTLDSERNILRIFVDSVPDYISVKDREERFLISNLAHSEAVGLTSEDFVGKTASDIYPPELAAQFHADDEQVLRFGEELISQEREILGPDGLPQWVLTTKKPIYDADGAIWGLVSISRDITKRREAELALRAAFKREKELSEQKDRFMAMVSHEFRTPLAVIQSSSQILQRYYDSITLEKRNEHLQKINQQIKHLDDMIENIMVITRKSDKPLQIKYEWMDLAALCTQLIESFANSIGSEYQLIFSCAENLENIVADADMLRIVISNLLSNAIKYSSKGTEIRLDLKKQDEECILEVRDQGIGISSEHIDHLFDAYYRADSSGYIKGIGLGLKIVKDFVELHEGHISVESVVGKGTTFTVSLPIKQDLAPENP